MIPGPAKRLSNIATYKFAELERIIAAKKAEGVDVISLGIGDPDTPSYTHITAAGQEAWADPKTHQYPTNRGRQEFREAIAAFYKTRFGVTLDPDTQVVPALGSKEGIHHISLAYLDEGDIALVSDPGYPVYKSGPVLVGAEPYSMPLKPELGFAPDLEAIPADIAKRAKIMFFNYPNNPTGAVVPPGFFEKVVAFAKKHNILAIHDSAYSEIVFEGDKAPSFLATPGAAEVGVEFFSLSKSYNMTGIRCAALVGHPEVIAHYQRLKTNVDSGMFEAVQMAGVAALAQENQHHVDGMVEVYRKRRDAIVGALRKIGVDVTPPKATIYVWAPILKGYKTSEEFTAHVLEKAAVVLSPGSMFGPSGEGYLRASLTAPDERIKEAVARIGALK